MYILSLSLSLSHAHTHTHTKTHKHTQPVGSSPSLIHNPRQEAYQMRMASSLATNQSAASSLKDQLKKSMGGGGGSGSSDGASASYKPHHQRLATSNVLNCVEKLGEHQGVKFGNNFNGPLHNHQKFYIHMLVTCIHVQCILSYLIWNKHQRRGWSLSL